VAAVLGAGGAAWAAGLKPYSGLILAAAALLLAYGYRLVYRRRPESTEGACAAHRPLKPRLALWVATAFWAAGALLNWAPTVLNVLMRGAP